MGSFFSKTNQVSPAGPKAGEKYNAIKDLIKPLDVILFRGDDAVSKTIQYLSGRELGPDAKKFSHCGFIVTRDILDIPELVPGRLYIFESTMSGALGGHVNNIHGHAFLGCQVRDFEEVIKSYDEPMDTQINWLRLIDNPFEKALASGNTDLVEFQKNTMKAFYETHDGLHYTVNLFQLVAAMFPSMRRYRPKLFMHEFVFCSELVAMMMRLFGKFRGEPANVVPADFAVPDQDKEMNHEWFELHLFTVHEI